MFLGGVVMLATGITLILNYGFFDEELLPPDLQNEEGKRTVGIILTCCGVLAIVISVIVSVLYFCSQSKSPTINPDDLHRIPTGRNSTPDSQSRRKVSTGTKINPMPNGTARTQHAKPIPGSAEVKLPRAYKKGRHRQKARHVRRLEEIKEQDAISRKTVDGALINDAFEDDTPRSGSITSEMTLDDQSRLPKVILNDYEKTLIEYENRTENYYENRPPSASSVTTSLTSDNSNYRFLDNDRPRREMALIPDSVRENDFSEYMSNDSTSVERYVESSLVDNKNADECSLVSDNLRNSLFDSTTPSQNSDNVGLNSAGGIDGQESGVTFNQSEVLDSDGSVVSYKASHYTELHGEKTSGRISPQIGEVELFTAVEARKQNTEPR